MQLNGPSQGSQGPTTTIYSERVETLPSRSFQIRLKIVLPPMTINSTCCPHLRYPEITWYEFFLYPVHVTGPAHLTILDLTTTIVFCEQRVLSSYSVRSSLRPRVTSLYPSLTLDTWGRTYGTGSVTRAVRNEIIYPVD